MADNDVYLLDIEGTTTPVDFVYKTLFPYAREAFPTFVEESFETPEVQDALKLLSVEHAEDSKSHDDLPGWEENPAAVADYCFWLMDRDRKSTGLKALQGLIWKAGYADGSLKSVVYTDVPEAFERWTTHGKQIYIYSSGSILAQKLLFGHTEQGDLTPSLSGYFDTTSGPKREQTSYETIAREIGIAPERICFLTDVIEELTAAEAAGMSGYLLLRDGAKVPDGTSDDACSLDFSSLK